VVVVSIGDDEPTETAATALASPLKVF
jgi:hypothetical protein